MYRLIARVFPQRADRDRGATAVEYGLMVALIAAVIVAAVFLLGGNLSTMFNSTATCVGTPTAANCP
jgi:pilus assembly protein Flp/PilA